MVRRVVTGHDANGQSCFLFDTPAPNVFCRSPGSVIVSELWQTSSTPADNAGSTDPTNRPYRLAPPKNGSVFRVIDYPPDSERLAALEREHSSGSADDSGHAAALHRGPARHPGFHRTHTIDYAIVMSGEIYALMEHGEVLLEQGDVLVQRGTLHAWSNRSDKPATVAFVLIDAEPAGI